MRAIVFNGGAARMLMVFLACVAGCAGRPAMVLDNDTPRLQPWHAQSVIKSSQAVHAGDVVLLTLDVRATRLDPETNESTLQIFAQRASPPWKGGDEAVLVPTKRWRRHEIPLRIREDMPAGGMQVALNYGLCRQRVEVRNLKLSNLGPREEIRSLRRPPNTYPGREPDAPWRKSAAARIEHLRKADFAVRLVDRSGQPIEGAIVRARLIRHEFPFGTAVVARRVLEDATYRDTLLRYFNTTVFESEMKWPQWEKLDAAGRARVIDAVHWLQGNGIAVRGHCLIWPGWGEGKFFVPQRIVGMVETGDVRAVDEAVAAHFAEMLNQFPNVGEWDVVNEPVFNQKLQPLLGGQIPALRKWFALFPREKEAVLNDYMMLSFGALNGERANELYELIESVNREEQLIDAIGEQAHFAETLVGPARMVQTLDRFARLGLPIRITELDIVTEDEQLQADYLRDFLTAAFSHPAVDGIVLWGFWEGQINKPQAALWRKDWSLKPAGRVFVDLLTDKWSTDVSLVSDDRGRVDFRGFRGEYELTVNASGATRTVRAHLTGGESVVTLP